MTKDEALKLALEALEEADEIEFWNKQKQAIIAIQEVLAQPEQEPVAWEQFYPDIGKPQIALNAEVVGYVAPQRTWVGLTDEEVYEIYGSVQEAVNEHWERGGTTLMFPSALYKAIDAKLRSKNT
jgi:hypothetical protein